MTSSLSELTTRREHRVDFLRGLALAMIFINHVPGNILALAYVVMMSPLAEWLRRIPVSNPLTVMGRHSLPAFCAGSLLAMAGAIVRFEWVGDVFRDTVIVIAGLGIPMLLAYMLDSGRALPRHCVAQAA